jgi:glycosyltransferase involved in cell wall biosynthesis
MRGSKSDKATADICIFVEGTYPYVTGGVSAWLHHLITNLPEFTFAICHLGSKPEPGRSKKYQFPPNVVGFHEIFLNTSVSLQRRSKYHSAPQQWKNLQEFHDAAGQEEMDETANTLRALMEQGAVRLDACSLLYSHDAWDFLTKQYSAHAPESPFLNYFWTFRSTHLPLFILNDATLPQARVYHAVSTGYAGYAAALAHLRTGGPLLITEHGIYTRERDMELAFAQWADQHNLSSYRVDIRSSHLKTWWTRMFQFMSRFTYNMADCIISITQSNQQYQLRDGADPDKLRLIPNGINTSRLSALHRKPAGDRSAFTIGFVGRVVPIKDVKTFIQAVKIISMAIPEVSALILGPTDEDEDYFRECQELVTLLELTDIVKFSGQCNVLEYYPQIDVLALTSLSEGQPLVILEANCAGIPVVASDVGACRDLLEGVTPEDRRLGPSGLLTLPASPQQTAEAVIRLWKDESQREQMAHAGRERVSRFYREEDVYAAYRDLYQNYLHVAHPASSTGASWPG